MSTIVQIHIKDLMDYILGCPMGTRSEHYINKPFSKKETEEFLSIMTSHYGEDLEKTYAPATPKSWRSYYDNDQSDEFWITFRRNTCHEESIVVDIFDSNYRCSQMTAIDLIYNNNSSVAVRHTPHICPLCGGKGEDLVFKFYCSNKICRNFHL